MQLSMARPDERTARRLLLHGPPPMALIAAITDPLDELNRQQLLFIVDRLNQITMGRTAAIRSAGNIKATIMQFPRMEFKVLWR